MGEQGRVERDVSLERPGVRVEDELVGVVALCARRLPGAVRAEAVALAGADTRHGAEPGAVRAVPQREPPLGLAALCVPVEEADLHRRRIQGVDREHRPLRREVGSLIRRDVGGSGRRRHGLSLGRRGGTPGPTGRPWALGPAWGRTCHCSQPERRGACM